MTSWSCPRSGYTVALPRTWTFIPSWSRMGHLEAAALKKAQKISAHWVPTAMLTVSLRR